MKKVLIIFTMINLMPVNSLKPFASFIILAYIVIRVFWELGTFDITMSPYYCLLNLMVLIPFLLTLLLTIVNERFEKKGLKILFILSLVYVLGYFILGLTLYPLLLTPRLQPKSLFIDMFTISIATFTLIYTIWLQLKKNE